MIFLGTFTLTDELFAKTLQSFETFVLGSNNLCRKLISSLELPITFDERLKLLPHPGTRSCGDIGTMFLCTSQRCRRCVSNETPNDASVERHQDVSVVRVYDVWLECRDDFSS